MMRAAAIILSILVLFAWQAQNRAKSDCLDYRSDEAESVTFIGKVMMPFFVDDCALRGSQ